MKVIGLTGGIGSGKTTVTGMLAELGACVINADMVGHEIYAPGTEGWRQVTAAFGNQIVGADGNIDRKKLGAVVFSDRTALARLNSIVHPLMAQEIRQRIDAHRALHPAQPIIVEAAVLIEANWHTLVDEVWLVTATRQAVVDRVHAERGLAPAEIESRIDAQLANDERRRAAHVLIENTGSLSQLRERVGAAWANAVASAP